MLQNLQKKHTKLKTAHTKRQKNKKGGFNHESVNTSIWALEAQQGKAPYKAAYFFEPMRLRGAVGASVFF